MPFGRRMTMHDHDAAKTAAPFEERFVDPGPVIAAEFREGRGERTLGRERGVDAAMHEDRFADPDVAFEAVEAREHLTACGLAHEFARQRCIVAAGDAAKLVDERLAVDAHPSVARGLRAGSAADRPTSEERS